MFVDTTWQFASLTLYLVPSETICTFCLTEVPQRERSSNLKSQHLHRSAGDRLSLRQVIAGLLSPDQSNTEQHWHKEISEPIIFYKRHSVNQI